MEPICGDANRKAVGQSYSINDWVIAVNYDNTKTVIDGGIVTSGTVQLAGSGGSILAGITGEGTETSSVRFWAGASKENRTTAPFRVLQDGSIIASKATIEGIIKAISGTIGGFEIAKEESVFLKRQKWKANTMVLHCYPILSNSQKQICGPE